MRFIFRFCCLISVSLFPCFAQPSLDPYWSSFDLIEDQSTGDLLLIDAAAVYRLGTDRELHRISGGAPFTLLVSLTLDSQSGEIYVADAMEAAVYCIEPTGQIRRVIGGVPLSRPVAVEWDVETQSLLVLDRGANALFKVTADGDTSWLFQGEPFNKPIDVARDRASGDFLVLEEEGALHRITSSGRVIETQPLEGIQSAGRLIQEAGTGDLLITDWGQGTVFRRSPDGRLQIENRSARSIPVGIVKRKNGSLLVTDLAEGQLRSVNAALVDTGDPFGGIKFATFTDVPSGHWAYDFVEWFSDLNITAGCGAGLFCPSGNVTRDQMAVFMVKLYKLLTVGSAAGDFMNPPAYRAEKTGTAPSDTPNVIAGASDNWATAGVKGATIAGGGDNNNTPIDLNNQVTDLLGTVGGGSANRAGDGTGTTGDAPRATVGGGSHNVASGCSATVAGGAGNVASAEGSTVGGGGSQCSSGGVSGNTASGNFSTVSGGGYNVANGSGAAIGGGFGNSAGGTAATVPGGIENTAAGNHSFAAGRYARANHNGSFVWADSTSGYFDSTGDNQFLLRAAGGVGINTANPEYPLDVLGTRIRLRNTEGGSARALFLRTDGAAVDVNAQNADLYLHAFTGNTIIQGFGGRVGIGEVFPAGTLDVNGPIYQRGGVLHADYVFEPGYELESIEKHAEMMWKSRHLPAVPSRTIDEKGREILEMGAHRRGLLEELEKAHIYIEQLNTRLTELEQKVQGR